MVEPTAIAIAILIEREHVLTGVRPSGRPLAGFHEFPGGRVEAGETVRQAAVRECFEETGLAVSCTEILLRTPWTYPHGSVELHFALCRLAEAADLSATYRGFVWTPIHKLHELNFPPANREILDLLRGTRDR